jgi:DNA-binding MarR family transcriptional regulator/GNAT superfamily N-acetyltransferase
MPTASLDRRIDAVRRFNRFYTRRIGVLREGLLGSRYSLAESRVIFELGTRDTPTAAELARDLELDPGYLSRIVRRLESIGLVERRLSPADARQWLLKLTKPGYMAYAELNRRSADEVRGMLRGLPEPEQERLLRSLGTVERVLGGAPEERAPYVLRGPQPGDLGWLVHRHAVLYAEEYGFDERFEGLVAQVAADFLAGHDAKRERLWIAERHGEIVGGVLLVRQAKTVAKLRVLYVEPAARGLGIGKRLVDECIRFARQAGYRKIMLWTNDVLTAARAIYEKAGFRLVKKEPHAMFGPRLVGETWVLDL